MNRGFKIVSIIFAIVFSVFVAALAGAFLAAWDTDNLETAYEIISMPKATAPEAKTRKIIRKNISIKDTVDGIADKGAKVSGFDTIFLPDSVDEPEDRQLHSITYVINQPEKTEETAEKKPEQAEEKKDEITITDEISGIAEITRAGDDNAVILNPHINDNSQPAISTGEFTLDPVESYPLPFTTVDKSYFKDALFIGDSRMQGFGLWANVDATYYAVTAFQLYKYKTFKVVQTPEGKMPIFDVMPYDCFSKIYIKVGLNEMGMSDAAFINDYTNLINDLRAMQPHAIIYIHAILPVTASKSKTDKAHCNENIIRRNAVLKNFSEVMKCYYVDVGPYVSDESGALIADSAADGIHMSGKYMPQWVQGLCEQAVVWPQ